MTIVSLALLCACILPTNNDVVTIQIDGTPFEATVSPDNKRMVFAKHNGGDKEIYVCDGDGKNAKPITDNDALDYAPSWSADGKRIVFCSTRSGSYQIHEMDLDGQNVVKLTAAPNGARLPRYSKDGWLAFQIMHKRNGKSHPADLVIRKDKNEIIILKKLDIMDYQWSPDGSTMCIGTVNKISFYDVATKKLTQMDVHKKDKRIFAHGAREITWSPDSDSVACRLRFLGGREGNPYIFGDTEVFMISKDVAKANSYEVITVDSLSKRKESWLKSRFNKKPQPKATRPLPPVLPPRRIRGDKLVTIENLRPQY